MPTDGTSVEAEGAGALLALQLQVARKADELARSRPDATGLNLHCWLLAEAEILGTSISERARLPETRPPPALNETLAD